MKKFYVEYTFNGFGKIVIEAKNKKEAEEKFYSGECEYNDEGEQYDLFSVKEIKE
jgi:hypothetical protein